MAFNVDAARERQEIRHKGDWKGCRRSGCEVLMIPGTHPDFRKALRSKEKSYRHKNGMLGRNADKPLPDDVSERHWLEAIAEELVKDWRRVEDKDGNAIAYKPSLCVDFLETITDFRLDIVDLLNAEAELEVETAETVEKN